MGGWKRKGGERSEGEVDGWNKRGRRKEEMWGEGMKGAGDSGNSNPFPQGPSLRRLGSRFSVRAAPPGGNPFPSYPTPQP